jgi:hypothetical protein
MDGPRQKLIAALSGSEVALSNDEQMTVDFVCHCEALHIFNLSSNTERQIHAATIPKLLMKSVMDEYQKLKESKKC